MTTSTIDKSGNLASINKNGLWGNVSPDLKKMQDENR